MARLVFETKANFLSYLDKFSGTGRMMLLDVLEDESLVLRPLVTSKGVDTAEIYCLKPEDKADIKKQFQGNVYYVRRIIWREDEYLHRDS